jgi:tape measure domain-containing protein
MSDALIIQVDSSQVEKGKKSLADLAAQGKKTEDSIRDLGKIYDRQGREITDSIIRQNKALRENQQQASSTLLSFVTGSRAASLGISGIITKIAGIGAAAGIAGLGVAGIAGSIAGLGVALLPVAVSVEKLNNTLKFSTGSAANAAKEIAYLKDTTALLGLEFQSTAIAYAKFSAASKGTALEGQKTRDIFESIAKASTVLGLSADETGGALKAIEQIISKGTVSAEELRGQLGERLPGAFQIAARAMGVTTEKLGDMLKAGELVSDEFLPKFAAELTKTLGDSPQSAAGSAQASLNRLSNSWRDFKFAIANSGVITVAITGVEAVTAGLNSILGLIDKLKPLDPSSKQSQKTRALFLQDRIDSRIPESSLIESAATKASRLNAFNAAQAKDRAELNALKRQLGIISNQQISPASGNTAQSRISPNFNIARKEGEGGFDARLNEQIKAGSAIKKSAKDATDALRKTEEERARKLSEHFDILRAGEVAEYEYAKSLRVVQDNIAASVNAGKEQLENTEREIDLLRIGAAGINDREVARIQETIAINESNAAFLKANALQFENNGYVQDAINAIDAQNKEYVKLIEIKNKNIEADARLNSFKIDKEQTDNLIKEAKRAQEEIAKDAEQTADSIYNSISDSIVRSLENGKGSFKTFYKSLINSAKASVIRFGVDFFLQGSGLKGILATLAGLFSQNASAGGISSLFDGNGIKSLSGILDNGFSGLGDAFGNGTSFITSGIEKLGTLIATGNGGILDSLGGLIGANAGAITGALPYAGAALQLLQGNIKGAAFTAIGAAIGGPIGAALGSFVGGLFGKKKIPRFSSQVLGAYDNGTFTSATGAQQYKPLGAEKQLAGLSEQFALTLGSFLKGFALDDAIKTQADLLQKRKSSYGLFSATFDGGSVSAGEKGRAKNVQKTFEALVETVLGETIVNAIQQTKVEQGIKDLFAGITDKTQVVNLINASVSLQNSQKELAERFGLTVGKAAEVSKATGKVGDALATFVNSLASAALAFKSPAQALLDVRDSFGTTLNNALGTVITTAVTEQVEVVKPATVAPKPTALQTLFGANGNNGFSLSSIVSAGLGQASSAIKSATQTVYESVTKYVETILPASVKLPASLAEFDTLLKDIDKSTATGVKQFADLFGIREQFAAYQAAVDSLKTGVQGSIFALSSESEQEALKVKALSDAFASLGLTAPTSREELIKLAQGLDYSTKSGLELANALPSLTTAWLDIKDNATNAADAIKASFQELYAATKTDGFKTYIDYIGYLATGKARGKDAANDQYFTQDYANTVTSNNQNQFAQANAEKQAAKKDKTTEEQDMLITVQKFGLDIKDDLKSIVKTLAIIQNDGLKVANA